MSQNSISEGGRPDAQNQAFLKKASKRSNEDEEPLKINKKMKQPKATGTNSQEGTQKNLEENLKNVENPTNQTQEEETNKTTSQSSNEVSENSQQPQIPENTQTETAQAETQHDEDIASSQILGQLIDDEREQALAQQALEEELRRQNNNNHAEVEEEAAATEEFEEAEPGLDEKREIVVSYDEIIEDYVPPVTYDIIFYEVNPRTANLEVVVGRCIEHVSDVDSVYTQEAREYTGRDGKNIIVVPFTSVDARNEAYKGLRTSFNADPNTTFCSKFYMKETEEERRVPRFRPNFRERELVPEACIIGAALSFTEVKPSEATIRSTVLNIVSFGQLIRVAIFKEKNFVSLILDNVEDYMKIIEMDQIHGNKWHLRIQHATCKIQSAGYYRLMFAPFPPHLCFAKGIRAMIRKVIQRHTKLDPELVISAGQVRREKNTGAGYGFVVVQGREIMEALRKCIIPNKSKKRSEKIQNGKKTWVEEEVEYLIKFDFPEAFKNSKKN